MRTEAEKRDAERILIIGLGNPLLGDDRVGWSVVEEFSTRFLPGTLPGSLIETDYLSLGGLSLMERMVGYDRVILVDAIFTGQKTPGSISCFPIEALPSLSSGHIASAHDTNLQDALQVGRSMGASLPARIDIVAIEAKTTYEFSEELSPPVASAVPKAVQAVFDLTQVN